MVEDERFGCEDFDADEFATELASRSDSDIQLQKQRRAIQMLSEDTAQSLKRNVYKNYAQFIETSKEISYLEAEMYQLSHLLTEQKNVVSAFHNISLSEQEFASEDQLEVEELADDSKNITSVLETVEGCSHITEVPNRACVHSSHVVELDTTSYVAVQMVRAYLLNDSLLIASYIKHRRGPVKYKFQALLELDSLAVVNVKDSEDVQNAFKVLMFPDSYMFQAETAVEKAHWLELIEKTKQRHKAQRDARKKSLASIPSFTTTAGSIARKSVAAIEAEKHQAEMLQADWLKDAPDDLDVSIAQRDFESAMELIEKSLSENHAVRDLRSRIDHRGKQLAEVLVKELRGSPVGSLRGGPRAARRAVGLLIRLGRSAQACDLFLKNRNKVIVHSLQLLKIEGSVVLYITKLAGVFFGGLLESVQEFQRAFKDDVNSSSAFVVWAEEQLQGFVGQLTSQLANKKGLSTVAECVEIAKQRCAKLCDVGLDFGYTMHKMLLESIVECINESRDQLVEANRHRASEETWKPVNYREEPRQLSSITLEMVNMGIDDFSNLVFDGGKVDLSSTTLSFCRGVSAFVQDGLKLYIPELYGVLIESIGNLFQEQLIIIEEALKTDQYLQEHDFIKKNASFLLETILPIIEERIEESLGRVSPELAELHGELDGLIAMSASNNLGDSDEDDSDEEVI
ncbi:exocyst complex component 8-like isoform X2 [Corticium candelabrum]|uniref:exocyst complex component 8-like isoform X2 n=1 Tax=Corticium candelabrum TaxID=121492 RepID=UPI002E26CE6B|nr:exocyst complex component 8-like isoform X2 [Corticium candelabrum]